MNGLVDSTVFFINRGSVQRYYDFLPRLGLF